VWQPRDLPIGVGFLLLGYAAVVGAVLWLASQGDPDTDPNLFLGIAIATLGFTVWLGAVVLILATRRGLSLEQLGFQRPRGRLGSWWPAVTVLGAYGIVVGYGVLIAIVESATGSDLSRLVEGNALPESAVSTALVWTVLGLAVVVAAPLCEELFFRSFIFRAIQARWGLIAGILISGAIFAVVHFEVSVALPFWGIGAWFAWAYHRSGSLWTTIVAHAIFNGISFAVTVSGVQP
jgi:hypothetical protein